MVIFAMINKHCLYIYISKDHVYLPLYRQIYVIFNITGLFTRVPLLEAIEICTDFSCLSHLSFPLNFSEFFHSVDEIHSVCLLNLVFMTLCTDKVSIGSLFGPVLDNIFVGFGY